MPHPKTPEEREEELQRRLAEMPEDLRVVEELKIEQAEWNREGLVFGEPMISPDVLQLRMQLLAITFLLQEVTGKTEEEMNTHLRKVTLAEMRKLREILLQQKAEAEKHNLQVVQRRPGIFVPGKNGGIDPFA